MKAESWKDECVAELEYNEVGLEWMCDGNVQILIQDICKIGKLFWGFLSMNS